MEESKDKKELERLKEYLIELNDQLASEAILHEQQIEELKSRYEAEKQQLLAKTTDHDVLKDMKEENDKLRSLIEEQDTSLSSASTTIANLKYALEMAEKNRATDIEMQTLLLKKDLEKAKQEFESMRARMFTLEEESRERKIEKELLDKSLKDLHARNQVIDELVEESKKTFNFQSIE